MRLWTLHPKYLDARGLVALWREALLAQKVLQGKTKGYHHHPQLTRFKAHEKPVAALAAFLREVHKEATRRGYTFDGSKIARGRLIAKISETDGQLQYEWRHLLRKLKQRAPNVLAKYKKISIPDPSPIFRIIAGEIRDWEVAAVKRSSSRKRRVSKASALPHRTSLQHKSAKWVQSRTHVT